MVSQGAQIKILASEDQKAEYMKLADQGQNKMLQVVFLDPGGNGA